MISDDLATPAKPISQSPTDDIVTTKKFVDTSGLAYNTHSTVVFSVYKVSVFMYTHGTVYDKCN